MAIKLERALRRFRKRSWTVRLVQRVLRSVPLTEELKDWYTLRDGLKTIAPDAPEGTLALVKEKGLEKRAQRAIRVMRLVDVADASIGIFGLFRAMFRVFRAKDGNARLEALESDPEQAVDAVLKGLAVAFVVHTLFEGSLTEKAKAFQRSESGRAMLTYFATVELGLPFADNVVEAGGNVMQKLLDRFGEGGAEKLASLLGDQADGALGMAKQLFNPSSLMPTPGKNLPVVGGNLMEKWDKLAGVAAITADMLPVYKYLGTRLVAEVCIERAVFEKTGKLPDHAMEAPSVREAAGSMVKQGMAGALAAAGGVAATQLGGMLTGGGSPEKKEAPALPPPPMVEEPVAPPAAPAAVARQPEAAPSSNPFAAAAAAVSSATSNPFASMAAAAGAAGAALVGTAAASGASTGAASGAVSGMATANPFAPPPPADPSPSGATGSPFAAEAPAAGPFVADPQPPASGSPFTDPSPAPSTSPFAPDPAPAPAPASSGSPFAPDPAPAPSGSPFAPDPAPAPAPSGSPFAPDPAPAPAPAASGSPFAPDPAPAPAPSGSPFAPDPAPSGSPFAPDPAPAAPSRAGVATAAAAAAGVAGLAAAAMGRRSAPEPAPAPSGSPFAPDPAPPVDRPAAATAVPTVTSITDGPLPPPAPPPTSDLPPAPPTTLHPVWPTTELPESQRLRGAYLSPDGRHWRVFSAEGVFSAYPPESSPPNWDAHWSEGHVTALYRRNQNRVTVEYFDSEPDHFTVQPEPYGMRIDREIWRRMDFDLTGRTMEGRWFDENGRPLLLDHDGRIRLGERGGHYRLGLASMHITWDDRKTEDWSMLSTLTPSSKHPQVLWVGGRRFHRPTE